MENITPMQAKALEELDRPQTLGRIVNQCIDLEASLQALADSSPIRRDLGLAYAVEDAIERTEAIRKLAEG